MSETSQQLEQLEVTMDEAKKAVALRDAIVSLQYNKDFNLVINECYLKDEAIRLVNLKQDDNAQSDEIQKSIITMIDAIGTFRKFMRVKMTMGDMAERALKNDEQTYEEILGEDLVND